MIWACPICQQALIVDAGSVVCSDGHRFDRSRQGYLPLLPAHHKRSLEPGDSRTMLLQRREFLQRGFYRPLADLLSRQMLTASEDRDRNVTCLDTGCGEGYYLHSVAESQRSHNHTFHGYGSDIAKEAVKLASANYKSLEFAVASSFQLPVLSDSVDILVRIFAPGESSEVARVLRHGGEFWRVVPGPSHLSELKSMLYQQVKLHDLPEVPAGFQLLDQQQLEFELELTDNLSVCLLLGMTPFAWSGSPEQQKTVRALPSLAVTASFVLQRYELQP